MIVVDANVLIYAHNTGDERFETARRWLEDAFSVRGKVLTDAHIAALAIENKASVATADRDFARFPGVRVFNPLL